MVSRACATANRRRNPLRARRGRHSARGVRPQKELSRACVRLPGIRGRRVLRTPRPESPPPVGHPSPPVGHPSPTVAPPAGRPLQRRPPTPLSPAGAHSGRERGWLPQLPGNLPPWVLRHSPECRRLARPTSSSAALAQLVPSGLARQGVSRETPQSPGGTSTFPPPSRPRDRRGPPLSRRPPLDRTSRQVRPAAPRSAISLAASR
jgi:hypothetical protein